MSKIQERIKELEDRLKNEPANNGKVIAKETLELLRGVLRQKNLDLVESHNIPR